MQQTASLEMQKNKKNLANKTEEKNTELILRVYSSYTFNCLIICYVRGCVCVNIFILINVWKVNMRF